MIFARKPPRAPRRDFKAILQLVPEAKGNPPVLKREMALLGKLRRHYPDIEFWLSLKPALPLGSLAYFLGDCGAAALKVEWVQYQTGKYHKLVMERREVDMETEKLERELFPLIDLDIGVNTRKVKETPISWASSK